MKKFLTIAMASSVLLAAPAAAQTAWTGQTYGKDAEGWYQLSANNTTFCKFGTVNTPQGNQRTTVGTAFSGYSEADGAFVFDIQNDDDNTVQQANGEYIYNNFVCNQAFTVNASSDNGGLKSDNTTSDPAFVELVPYQVDLVLDGINGTDIAASTQSQQLISSSQAQAGGGVLYINVPARDELVLQGAYRDTLRLTVTPNASGGSVQPL